MTTTPELQDPQTPSLLAATMFFDGAAEPNPGHGSAGWVLQGANGVELTTGHAYLGDGVTNNQAEYHALLKGLGAAQDLGVTHLQIRGDSQLVVNHFGGSWKCKNETLRGLLAQAHELAKSFVEVQAEWIRRDENSPADDLSKRALQEAGIVVHERHLAYRRAAKV